MKRWIGLQIIIVSAVTLFGLISKTQFADSGILGIRNIEDTYKINCGLMYYFGDNKDTGDTEEDLYNNLITYEDDYVNDSDLAPIVIIGCSTGNLVNYNNSIGQEIIVEKLMKGSDIEEGGTYYVYSNESFELNTNSKIVYTGLKNLMDPDCKYLIFLEPSKLNGISQKKTYSLKGSFFSYLNLSKDTLYPITKPLEEVKYSELRGIEYFAESQRILEQIDIIKKRIIKKYCF